jgi:hypothetical protein
VQAGPWSVRRWLPAPCAVHARLHHVHSGWRLIRRPRGVAGRCRFSMAAQSARGPQESAAASAALLAHGAHLVTLTRRHRRTASRHARLRASATRLLAASSRPQQRHAGAHRPSRRAQQPTTPAPSPSHDCDPRPASSVASGPTHARRPEAGQRSRRPDAASGWGMVACGRLPAAKPFHMHTILR